MATEVGALASGVWVESVGLAWTGVEAAVGLAAAVAAGSIALGAFGADSLLEIAAGVIVLRRLRAEQSGHSGVAEMDRRAARLVGYLLLAVAALVVAGAGQALLAGHASRPSAWGIGLAVASLVLMPLVVRSKRRVAARIGSRALAADAACGTACTYMAGTLLVGLGLRAALGWWWADPLAGLGIVYFVAREGIESIGIGH